jgi:predicted nicotinamide N-methyase
LSLKEKLIIEMGCGSTGIPGIVSMASGASDVVFCDLDGQALLELAANIDENLPLLEQSRISLDIEIFKPTYSFYTGDWKDLNDFLSPSPHFPPLVLASEIVYDAILVEPLVRCIDRLISLPSGSMIFCQSRHGRGNLDEFFRMMLKDPYNYKFHQIDVDTEERDFLDDFIFGIFRK